MGCRVSLSRAGSEEMVGFLFQGVRKGEYVDVC